MIRAWRARPQVLGLLPVSTSSTVLSFLTFQFLTTTCWQWTKNFILFSGIRVLFSVENQGTHLISSEITAYGAVDAQVCCCLAQVVTPKRSSTTLTLTPFLSAVVFFYLDAIIYALLPFSLFILFTNLTKQNFSFQCCFRLRALTTKLNIRTRYETLASKEILRQYFQLELF